MHRVVFAALATILAIFTGAARAELASRTEERGAVHIAVLGDSLADGLWGSLYRKYYRDRRVKVFDLGVTRSMPGATRWMGEPSEALHPGW